MPAYVPYGVDKAQTVYPQYCATPRLAVSPLEVNPLQTVPSQGEGMRRSSPLIRSRPRCLRQAPRHLPSDDP